MRTARTLFAFSVAMLLSTTASVAQLGIDHDLGTDYITFGSFEGYGDNDGQLQNGSFMPELISGAQNSGGFTFPTVNTRCWEHSRWPDIVRYYWRYYQNTTNLNASGTSNVAGNLIHRLNTGNTGMSHPLNAPSWNNSPWNNQYLLLRFFGPTTPNHLVLYQELRTAALPGVYDFEMRFRSNVAGMRVRLYGTAIPRVTCASTNGVANQIIPGNLLYDSGALTANTWHPLAAALTTTTTISSVLIQVSMADGSAPPANTSTFYDDIHLFSNDCTPRWTEPQSQRNTYGTVSTGDICALLAAAIAQDGSPDHMMIDQLRILCGMDGCTPPCDPNCPLDLDGSGIIDQPDIDILTALYGTPTSNIINPCHVGADANGDGTVSVADLLIFIGAFGSPCGTGGMVEQPNEPVLTKPTMIDKDLFIVPNPTNGKFRLSAPLIDELARRITVYDAQGKVVLTMSPTLGEIPTIDLEGSPNGVYMVTVQDGGTMRSLRLVKE